MAKLNVPREMKAQTYEGGTASPHIKPLEELRRAVSTCLLFEETFYEKGSTIAARISSLCDQVPLTDLATLAVEARTVLKLRHVPLYLVCEMVRVNSSRKEGSQLVSSTLAKVILRPDELAEFLAIYWRNGKRPLASQVKLGLASAYTKFSAESLSKWNRDGAIKLRDVLFMVHAKPKDEQQAADWKALVDRTLVPADTWEVALSAGKDKKETWERLIREKQLGYIALLMNLRSMAAVGVDQALVESSIRDRAKGSWALPFRFITAARHAPQYAQALSDGMLLAIEGTLEGSTAVVIDVSGSMNDAISAKSEVSRWETASALAVLIREMCAQTRVFTFSRGLVEVSNLRGLGLIHGIGASQKHDGTYLAGSLKDLHERVPGLDRVVVVTDEQSHDGQYPAWTKYAYLINVASYKPGLDTIGGWKRISGWSEQVVRWMQMEEARPAEVAEPV